MTEKPYSDAFERLVDLHADGSEDPNKDHLRGLVAYALYKQGKREWVIAFKKLKGRPPEEADFADCTRLVVRESVLRKCEQDAATLLEDYQRAAVETSVRQVVDTARTLRTGYWVGVSQSIVGAFLFSALLGLVLLVAQKSGADVLAFVTDVMQAFVSNAEPAAQP